MGGGDGSDSGDGGDDDNGDAEQVHFSVATPESFGAKMISRVDVWAFTDAQRERVMDLVSKDEHEIAAQGSGPKLNTGSQLQVFMEIPTLEVHNSVAIIYWEGQPAVASFTVSVPSGSKVEVHTGIVKIFSSGLLICNMTFAISTKTKKVVSEEEQLCKAAFASYSSKDRSLVMTAIQAMKKVAPNLVVRTDREEIRSGEDWRNRLMELIPTQDVFFLFWSKEAAASTEIEWEWKFAKQRRGLNYIDPFPLVSPAEVPPPPELAKLHFEDKYRLLKHS